jgi:hypothetical protein
MGTETTETPIHENVFQPVTPLGRKLWEIRQQIVANGEALLGWEELEQEVTERQNERGQNTE